VRYIVFINWTQSGLADFEDSLKRIEAMANALEQAGGRFEIVGHCLGEIDLVATIDVPSGHDVAAFVVALGSRGSVRTVTLQAFETAEMRDILQRSGPLAKAYLRGGAGNPND